MLLPMPGSPPSSTSEPGHHPAAQHAVELADAGDDARLLARRRPRAAAPAARCAAPRRSRAACRARAAAAHLLLQRVPLPAGRALAEPLGRGVPALGAGVDGPRSGWRCGQEELDTRPVNHAGPTGGAARRRKPARGERLTTRVRLVGCPAHERAPAPTPPADLEPISTEEALRLIRHTAGPELEALLARAGAVRRGGARQRRSPSAASPTPRAGAARRTAASARSRRTSRAPARPSTPMMTGARDRRPRAAPPRRPARASSPSSPAAPASRGSASWPSWRRPSAWCARRPPSSPARRSASCASRSWPGCRRPGCTTSTTTWRRRAATSSKVCTTHSYDEQLETVRAAKELGLKLCTGGILGMGETPEQRVEFAETVRDAGRGLRAGELPEPAPGHPHGGAEGHHAGGMPGGGGGLPADDAAPPTSSSWAAAR